MAVKINWDAFGIGTSVACAIHCAVLPIIASSLPVFGIELIHNVFFEWTMISIAFIVGTYSLFHGYIKHHRSLAPVFIFTFGFLFLVFKEVYTSLEIPFLIIAVVFIISAHYYNYKLCHRSKCTSAHHVH
ncbi:MAG: MerC domain-containing protein [Bacteroidota bacterium]